MTPKSATRGLHGHSSKTIFGINENHSEMVKFRERDPNCQVVFDKLQEICEGQKADRPSKHRKLSLVCGEKSHWMVPFGRNQDFVGRESVLAQLLERIPPSADEDDCQRTAIEGLGGIGKTQIALEAAFRVRDEQDCSVFWVPAVDATSFENAYREIGRKLEVKGIDEDKADVMAMIKAALSCESAGSWLLVVDNADDTELLRTLIDYLPFNYSGSILFTTRNHETSVELDIAEESIITTIEMNEAEALQLLRRNLKESQLQDTTSMTSLLDFLAYLPLAIRQASAYLAKTRMSIAKYLGHCQSSNKRLIELLSKDFQDRGRYKTIRNAVATTWLVSFEQISHDNPLAAAFLKFMSFMAEKDIPRTLLPAGDELEVDEAIGTLKAYAFITERGQTAYDMHRLVRLAMRNWLEERELEKQVSSTMQRLDQVFPFPQHENRDLWLRYLPHVLAALEFRDVCTDQTIEGHLLEKVGETHRILGKYQQAEQMYQQTAKLMETALGREHPNTLQSMNNLAVVLDIQGKYEEAKQMHQQTLKLMETVLGREHPNTLVSMGNLALALGSQGKYPEAEKMHRQEWMLCQKVLGREHPNTLRSINNLALVLDSQGKYEEAEQMHRQTLKLMETVLGREHPNTLDSMSNLARVLGRQGKYSEAGQMHWQTLKLRETVLGREHPNTFDSMNALANVLNNQGRHEDAEKNQRRALEGYRRVLGQEHPRTLESMGNLAIVLETQGKYAEAEQMYRQALELMERGLGNEHPTTKQYRRNLDGCLKAGEEASKQGC